jgi:hypothetical protein
LPKTYLSSFLVSRCFSIAWLVVSTVLMNGASARAECCGCMGDINKDSTVDGADLGLLLSAWNSSGTPDNEFCEDVNSDGAVDGADLGLLLGAWQSCLPVTCSNPCVNCTGTPENETCGGHNNDGCDDPMPEFHPMTCGETVCSTLYSHQIFKDVDWYQVDVPSNVCMVFTAKSDYPLLIGYVDTGGTADCSLPWMLNPVAIVPECGTNSITVVLSFGTHWFRVIHDGFHHQPCGTAGENEYSVTLTCFDPVDCR